MAEIQEQIVREAPEIEAYKLGLLESAKKLADQGIQLPPYMIAGLTGLQQKAADLTAAGIGGYQPYLTTAGTSLQQAQQGIANAMQGALPYQQQAQQAYQQALMGTPQVIESAMRRADLAAQQAADRGVVTGLGGQLGQATMGARGLSSEAASALQRAGALGTESAQQGIARLAGTTGAFDPSSVSAFMNPYQQAVIDETLQDIAREGEKQRAGLAARAIGAGAFGGSRMGLQEAELTGDILQKQAEVGAQLRSQAYESAAQRAQQAFEQQQARSQQAAQLTGALGAQGAGAGLQAAQASGQLGMSAEQLAAANAQALASTGLNLQQLQAQTGMNAAQLAGQLGMQGQTLTGNLAQGLGSLGAQYGQLGMQAGQAIGQLGMDQARLGQVEQALGQQEQSFMFDMGKQLQAQQQAELDAARQSQMQQYYEPYQRLGFVSDIYKGAPSSQMAFTQTSGGNVSPAQSYLGLGIAGLSAAAGAQRAGLF